MYQLIQFKTTVPHSISRLLPLRRSLPRKAQLPRTQARWIIRGSLLIPLVLACFGFSPAMQAVNPPPDGGYAGANTAEGTQALQSLTTGLDNTAIGYQSLFSTTTGSFNTAAGFLALRSNTTGTRNTAIGYQALYLNTTGSFSVGIGLNTLFHNTTGSFNSANGYYALFNNTTGSYNVACGLNALYGNTTGDTNTAYGFKALFGNKIAADNNAVGDYALLNNDQVVTGWRTSTTPMAVTRSKLMWTAAKITRSVMTPCSSTPQARIIPPWVMMRSISASTVIPTSLSVTRPAPPLSMAVTLLQSALT